MTLGTGWVDVSEQLIRNVLHAPAQSRIVGAEFDQHRHCVRLLFASPDLPTTRECEESLDVTIKRVGLPSAPEFVWSWNA